MENAVVVILMALPIACLAEKVSDNGFVGCKNKKDVINLALIAQSGAPIEEFKARLKKLETSKKCRMFKKGETIEMYTFGDKETGVDIHQIAFPHGSDHYFWIDKRAVAFD